MREELRAEYDRVLTAVILQRGAPRWAKNENVSRFAGPTDWKLSGHMRNCRAVTTGEVNEEVEWYEFSGTFAGTDASRRYGISVSRVTCACGTVTDREILWESDLSQVAAAVFEKMYEMVITAREEER